MSNHNITLAETVYQGAAYYEKFNTGTSPKRGLPVSFPIFCDLGAPAVADADSLVKAATSTELPNAETVTYVIATAGGSSPIDGVDSDGIQDVARNIVSTVTHGSSVVAMTIVYTGLDAYGETVSETHTIPATGTSQVVNGAKAFKSITSVAITAAGNAEANTLNAGFGDVIGLPYRITDKNQVLTMFDGQPDAAVVVIADDTTATATTGDIRGTVNPNGTLDGSKKLGAWIVPASRTTKTGAFGIAQYGG